MSAQNGYVQFVNDDRGYLRWLALNPGGYVVNSLRTPTGNYLKLHRASCKHINTGVENNWTTAAYIKTCSTDPAVLDDWAVGATCSTVSPCGSCKPDYRPRVTSPSPRATAAPVQSGPLIRPAPSPVAPAVTPGIRSIPPTISTGCTELDRAWESFAPMILNSHIPIPDTDDDLNWHAFLGHSIDMQGFRAAEFAGVDPLSKEAPRFVSLKQRGIGVPELGRLWDIPAIRDHLLKHARGTPLNSTITTLRRYGGPSGQSLAEAFETFPYRKGHWTVRAYLQNSAALRDCDYSFRTWLQRESQRLGVSGFPPADFRAPARGGTTLEMALRKRLMSSFVWVKNAMSPYMLCDWQLWLWREGRTAVFANFKLDSFHEAFVKKFSRGVVPADEAGFARWWLGLYPELPPRLANECIWLAVDGKQVDPW